MAVPFPTGTQIDQAPMRRLGELEHLVNRTLIYVQGVAGGVTGAVVTVAPLTGVTALLTDTGAGLIAVLLGDIAEGTFGFAQVFGVGYARAKAGTVMGDAEIDDATPGQITNPSGAGVHGIQGLFVIGPPVDGLAPVWINYPTHQST